MDAAMSTTKDNSDGVHFLCKDVGIVPRDNAIIQTEEDPTKDSKDSPTLPTELWVNIFQRLDRVQDVVPLRLVSSYFKEMVDQHLTFKVGMIASNPRTIPDHHVRISDLQMINFEFPESNPSGMFQDMTKLKNFCVRGPIHPSLLHHVIVHSHNLDKIKLDSNGFLMSTLSNNEEGPLPVGSPSNIPSIRHLHNLSMLSIYQPDYARYVYENGNGHYPFPNTPPSQLTAEGFVHALPALLQPPIMLPLLTKLNLQFEELSLSHIFSLCHNAIIPFLKTQSETLQVLQIHLTGSDVWNEPQASHHPPFPSQSSGTKSMATLTDVYFMLPDIVLNGIFKTLWDQQHIPQNTIKCFKAHWEFPMMDYDDLNHNNNSIEQWNAFLVVQQILKRNAGSLIEIAIDGLDAQRMDLFDGTLPHTYPLLQYVWISARSAAYYNNTNQPLVPRIQRTLFRQNCPVVTEIYLSDLGVELRAFQDWIMECPELTKLKIEDLIYENGDSIDEEFILAVISKQPILRDVRINLEDLKVDWSDQDYWNDIKSLPFQFSDDGEFLFILM